MADPITIIGTAGAVANIIDVAAKTIGALRELHGRWKDADFTLLNLIAQMTALKSALTKIEEWLNLESEQQQHYQLTMDLDLSITCCSMLINKMDGAIQELITNEHGDLVLSSKIKLLFGERQNEDFQKLLDRQINVLTLILTACSCKEMSEQKLLLEKSTNRNTIAKMKTDTESLYVHYDVTSTRTMFTDKLSKFSREFSFDWEILITKVYGNAYRSATRAKIKEKPASTPSIRVDWDPDRESRKRSEEIDKLLKADRKRISKETRILLTGSESETLQQLFRFIEGDISRDERLRHRAAVWKKTASAIAMFLETDSIEKRDLTDQEHDALESCIARLSYAALCGSNDMPPADLHVLKELFSKRFANVQGDAPTVAPSCSEDSFSFLKDLIRIWAPDYLPTDADIFDLPYRHPATRPQETEVYWGKERVRLIIAETNNFNGKQIKFFPDLTASVFLYDITTSEVFEPFGGLDIFDELNESDGFEEVFPDEPLHSMLPFASLVNSQNQAGHTVLVVIYNMHLFREKIAPQSTLRKDSHSNTHAIDFTRATNSLIFRFKQINKARLRLQFHFIDKLDSTADYRLLMMTVSKAVKRGRRIGIEINEL